jgi:hypothetical protein
LTLPTPKEIMTPPTPDDTARTWRDLADQLTPEQIAILEDPERHRRDYGTPWSDSELLDIARRYARRNITDEVLFGHIAPPADATRTNGWWCDRHDNWTRGFHGTQRADSVVVRVGIFGTQSADGSVTTRHIGVHTSTSSTQPAPADSPR